MTRLFSRTLDQHAVGLRVNSVMAGLIAASLREGFGLPLATGAQMGQIDVRLIDVALLGQS